MPTVAVKEEPKEDNAAKPAAEDDDDEMLDDNMHWMLTIELDDKEMKQFKKSPSNFIVRKMKGAEVSYGRLDRQQQLNFDAAKAKEVNQFISTAAVRRCKDEAEKKEANGSNRIIKARWILTWKPIPESEQAEAQKDREADLAKTGKSAIEASLKRKAKARIVLIGYQHPDLMAEGYKTASPVVGHGSKLLLLQMLTMRKWRAQSIDAVTAFLQTEACEEARRLWTRGVPELTEALGCEEEDEALRILRSIYGLTTSPRAFFLDVSKKLESFGGRRLLGDPCIHVFLDGDQVIGVTASHVDDFLISGCPKSAKWKSIFEQITGAYRWGELQSGTFRFSGIDVTQHADFSFTLSQQFYVETIPDMPFTAQQLQNSSMPLTPSQITSCKEALGALAWLATQTSPLASARVGLYLSECKEGCMMKTPQKIQQLIAELRREYRPLTISTLDGQQDWTKVAVVTFSDASLHNRDKGGSTGGIIHMLADSSVVDGNLVAMTIVGWRSWRLKRVAISSNDAEVQTLVEAEDGNFRFRLLWSELNGGPGAVIDENLIRRSEAAVAIVKGLTVSDSKGGYDAIERLEGAQLGLTNVRTAIQAHSLKQCFSDPQSCLKWVAGVFNLSDALTKDTRESRSTLIKFYDQGSWRVKFDPNMVVSGRRLKQQQKENLEIAMVWLDALCKWQAQAELDDSENEHFLESSLAEIDVGQYRMSHKLA